LGYYWLHGSSSRGGFWRPFLCRCPRLNSNSRLSCHLRHGLFNGGGWTEAPLSRSAHRVPVVLFPLIRGVGRWNVPRQLRNQLQRAVLHNKYSTTLFEELTSWAVASVTFSFLATHFRATLRGLLGGIGRLASKLVGLSSMRGMWGGPGRLNLDRN
jgi:hypothetical protein